MPKKYNDIVTLVNGKTEVPALVVQSVPQQDGEHLTVVYLDPSKESPLLSGMNVDAAIQRAFVTPLADGKTFGWKELPIPDTVDPAAAGITGENIGKTTEPTLTDDEVYEEVQADFIKTQQIVPPAGSTVEQVFKAAGRLAMVAVNTMQEKADECESLHSKLTEVEKELAETTEGIDKKLQALADENAVKKSAPEELDEAQGEIQPGDPESPHAIDQSTSDSSTSNEVEKQEASGQSKEDTSTSGS